MFLKPVDRPIEGVIKADDDASLRNEIEEYVLTNEVERRLEAFFSAYNNYAGANGVWISGFFGSGKSHLLKMLALLLENRSVSNITALELFLPKCGDNQLLRADLQRAVAIPSRSILFNIDQKADVISKTQIDALLAVFVKVFDDMCGYYGKQGHIAQFERDLDSRGLLGKFQAAYQASSGRPWQTGREQALLEAPHIAAAYAAATGSDPASAAGILDKYRTQHRVSIEDFAAQVEAWLNRQPTGFRLNFFVDEVGQYIADNVKLMTNLQTIAESLATRCRGRAWIIVTAQEEMASVVGEMTRRQAHDFSKIQARFLNRMKLTSADVAEVIQKRLLSKTAAATKLLADLYQQQSNNFRTLFDFSDGSQTYRNFTDCDHFIQCYPFIPWQFALFQSAIQNLSQHNAFEGRHSSVGERSMLGVFQQVAIHIGKHQPGHLATFDLMFEGIRTSLKSNIQRAVIQAENHLPDPFAIRVLKTLFLVKYVREFKATPRNLCVLMLERFNQDLPALRKRVDEALSLLEQQAYIQRRGEIHEFLTDEEKDVEQEIRNTDVDAADVAAELESLIFDQIIRNRKIRSENNGRDYPFSRKLDDRLHGREAELAIHVITPFHEHSENESILRMVSMGRDELFVVLPPDDRLVRDLLLYKRTEKYIRQNISITQQEAVKRILAEKSQQNRERQAELQQRLQQLLGRARQFLAGSEIHHHSDDPLTRISRGFQDLIERTYPNAAMLRSAAWTENDIARCLKQADQGLYGNDVVSLSEAEQEILAFLQSNARSGVRTTLKHLLERFERKPYGWHYPAILCNLGCLCARGRVEVRRDSQLLEQDELERGLRNTHEHPNIVLEPQLEFTASQTRALKIFFEDFFEFPPRNTEARAIARETAAAFQQSLTQLRTLASQTPQYPFLSCLQPAIPRLEDVASKPAAWFLTDLPKHENELLDLRENVLEPVRSFMAGPQKEIYDQARSFLHQQQPNFASLNHPAPAQFTAALNDPQCFRGGRMQQLKQLLEQTRSAIEAQLAAEVNAAITAIHELRQRLTTIPEFLALPTERQTALTAPFQQVITQIQQQSLIAVVRDRLRQFEELDYQRLLAQLTESAPQPVARKPSPYRTSDPARDNPATSQPMLVAETTTQFIPLRQVRTELRKAWLADEADVDQYLHALRSALLEHIRDGRKIQL
jgi:hypothetical protein